MENSFTLLLDLHQAVWLLLKEPESEERWDNLAKLHIKTAKYLIACGFELRTDKNEPN